MVKKRAKKKRRRTIDARFVSDSTESPSRVQSLLWAVGASIVVWITVGSLWSEPGELAAAAPRRALAKEAGISPLAITGPSPAPIEPPSPAAIDNAIARGVRFLLDDQRPDGSWGSPERTKGLNIFAPVPGAHDAFQALMAGFAAPEIMAAKRLAWAALADGRGPGGLDLPTDRHARTALRVALRQARHTDGPSPALDAWTAAVEPAQGEAGDDADAGADHG